MRSDPKIAFILLLSLVSCGSPSAEDLAEEFCSCLPDDQERSSEAWEEIMGANGVEECMGNAKSALNDRLGRMRGERKRSFLVEFSREIEEGMPESIKGTRKYRELMEWMDAAHSVGTTSSAFGSERSVCTCWKDAERVLDGMLRDEGERMRLPEERAALEQVSSDCGFLLEMSDDQLKEALADCDLESGSQGHFVLDSL